MYESLSFDYQRLQEKQEQLEGICRELSARNNDLAWELDSQEQYGRRNCLLCHGVAEPPQGMRIRENTDAAVIDIMTNKLGLQVNDTDLDRSHRVGRKTQRSTKPRPIIVKFVTYKVRAEVFRSKRGLKKTGLGNTESLTRKKAQLYSSVKFLTIQTCKQLGQLTVG